VIKIERLEMKSEAAARAMFDDAAKGTVGCTFDIGAEFLLRYWKLESIQVLPDRHGAKVLLFDSRDSHTGGGSTHRRALAQRGPTVEIITIFPYTDSGVPSGSKLRVTSAGLKTVAEFNDAVLEVVTRA
jgi:hypothetical protein